MFRLEDNAKTMAKKVVYAGNDLSRGLVSNRVLVLYRTARPVFLSETSPGESQNTRMIVALTEKCSPSKVISDQSGKVSEVSIKAPESETSVKNPENVWGVFSSLKEMGLVLPCRHVPRLSLSLIAIGR